MQHLEEAERLPSRPEDYSPTRADISSADTLIAGHHRSLAGSGYQEWEEVITSKLRQAIAVLRLCQVRIRNLKLSDRMYHLSDAPEGWQIRANVIFNSHSGALSRAAEVPLALTEVCCEIGIGKASGSIFLYVTTAYLFATATGILPPSAGYYKDR